MAREHYGSKGITPRRFPTPGKENEQAERNWREACVVAERNGSPLMIGRVLHEWGEIKLRHQQFEAAEEYFRQALAIVRQQSPEQVSVIQASLLRLALAQGEERKK